MNFLILVVKGFIIGIAKVIPGVSGAVIMISFGLYEKCLDAIINFWDNKKENIKLLLPISIGVLLAIVLGSKMIAFLLELYKASIILCFLGLIIGTLPSFTKEVRSLSFSKFNKISFFICFLLVILLSFSHLHMNSISNKSILLFMFIGFIDALTMIIPGISGTAILMLLGLYEITVNFLASLSTPSTIISNMKYVLSYGTGLAIGVLLVSYIMDYLFKKHMSLTYYGILGFQYSTVIVLILNMFNYSCSLFELAVGLLLFVFGLIGSIILEKMS